MQIVAQTNKMVRLISGKCENWGEENKIKDKILRNDNFQALGRDNSGWKREIND